MFFEQMPYRLDESTGVIDYDRLAVLLTFCRPPVTREIGILLPNNQRQPRTLHIQQDVLPYALW